MARLLLPLALLLAGCGERPAISPEYELAGATMGTTFSVKLVAPPEDLDRGELQGSIHSLLDRIDSSMSTYRLESEISRFNAHADGDWFEVSTELCEAVREALAICELSNGSFDVTVGPLVNLWGFGPQGTITAPPDAAQIDAARSRVGHNRLHTDCARPALRKDIANLYVDLSGYAKGLAVDRIAELLDERAVENFLVEIGGEMRLRGRSARGDEWAIAIEKPLRSDRTVQTVGNFAEAAIATSGDYRNYFEYDGKYYSHTIDPHTGYPVSHDTASVTVIADSAAFADAMATALLVMGHETGLAFAEQEEIAALFLSRADDEFEEHMTEMFLNRLSPE